MVHIVLDRLQVKPCSLEGRRCKPSIAVCEEFGSESRPTAPAAHRHQQADQVTHHMMEECVGSESEDEQCALALDCERLEPPHRRRSLTLRGAKR